MIAVVGLIASLAFVLPSVGAFPSASARPSSNRSRIHGQTSRPPDVGSPRGAARTPDPFVAFQISNRQSQVPALPAASESKGALHDMTAVVGRTASAVVSGSFFLLLAYRRDAVVLALWIGSILNAILGKVAKRVLNQERPAELRDNDRVRLKPGDGGMPSSHAMSLGFIGVAVTGAAVPGEYQLAAGLAMATYSALALRYRVTSHLHTAEQVAVGLVLGTWNALAWLSYGVGVDGDGPVTSWVRDTFVSAETGLFPYSTLVVPIVVGIVIVGSFERRIGQWMKGRGSDG